MFHSQIEIDWKRKRTVAFVRSDAPGAPAGRARIRAQAVVARVAVVAADAGIGL